MDCQISCTSSLPHIWAIETLACSNNVDISLLLDLLEKTPEICNDIGRNARELVSLKILEGLLIQRARVNPSLSQTIRLDPSDHCEDVLRQILSELSPTRLKFAGTEIFKWDLEPFIEYKRSNLQKNALKQLKDAILTGSHSISASLKERSGLLVGNQAEHEALAKNGNCDGITPRVERSNTDDSFLLPRDMPDENLVRINRKRRATSESAAEKLCTSHINSVKKHKHDNISTAQYLGRKLISLGDDKQIAGMSVTSVPQVDGKCYGFEGKTHVESMELNEPPKDGDNGYTSSKELVGPDKVLPHGKQVVHCDAELNNKSEEQSQSQNIEEAKGDKNGFSDLKRTNEVGDNSERNIQIVGEVEELDNKSEGQGQDQNIEEAKGDKSGFSDFKRANEDWDNSEQNMQNVGGVEELNNKSEEQGQYQNIKEAKGDKIGFSDLKRSDEDRDNSEQNIQNVGELEELNNKSKGQGQDLNIEVGKGEKNGFSDLKRTNEDGDNFEQNIRNVEVEEHAHMSNDIARKENASFGSRRTYSQDFLSITNCRDPNLLVGTSKIYSGEERCSIEKKSHMGRNGPSGGSNNQFTSPKGLVMNDEVVPHEKHPTVGEAEEDVDESSDNDEYYDERTNIDTKKKLFLSSQCTNSQDSLATTDWRELQLCVKCNKIGELLSCASDSCPLMIHESCFGSDVGFDTREEFYCPFCAYSRAISKYMEVKKKSTLARKDLATFICLGTQQKPKKPSQRSLRIKGNHLQQNDGLSKSNELNQRDGVDKVSNHLRKKKLEFEKAGPSESQFVCSPSLGGKAIDPMKRLAQSLNKEKQDDKSMRQASQSLRVHGQQQITALEIHHSQGESTSSQVSETSGSEKHAVVRSKKGFLPCERNESSDEEESSEQDDDSSGASKFFIRVRKHERPNYCAAVPQLRRKRLPWTSIEEDKLKEGIRLFSNPDDKIIPWKTILDHGKHVFQPSRSTMDLKDKWRNMCKASPKFK